jgi:hypothetical protein
MNEKMEGRRGGGGSEEKIKKKWWGDSRFIDNSNTIPELGFRLQERKEVVKYRQITRV